MVCPQVCESAVLNGLLFMLLISCYRRYFGPLAPDPAARVALAVAPRADATVAPAASDKLLWLPRKPYLLPPAERLLPGASMFGRLDRRCTCCRPTSLIAVATTARLLIAGRLACAARLVPDETGCTAEAASPTAGLLSGAQNETGPRRRRRGDGHRPPAAAARGSCDRRAIG